MHRKLLSSPAHVKRCVLLAIGMAFTLAGTQDAFAHAALKASEIKDIKA